MQPRRYQTKRRRKSRPKARAIMVMAGLVIVVSGVYAFDASRTAGAKKTAQASTPDSRNAARAEALTSIAAGIGRYLEVNKALATALPATATEICVASSNACRGTGLYDANFLVTTDTGLLAIPSDPIGGPGQYGSGYFIARDANGAIVLTAPRAENGKVISLTR